MLGFRVEAMTPGSFGLPHKHALPRLGQWALSGAFRACFHPLGTNLITCYLEVPYLRYVLRIALCKKS